MYTSTQLQPKLVLWSILLLICFGSYPAFGQLPEGFVDQVYANGFDMAIGLTFDDQGRAYAWERDGRVFVVDNGVKTPSPLLDIRDDVAGWRDFGLLCVTLDPNFSTNGYLYVLYTYDHNHKNKGAAPDTWYCAYGRIVRYTVSNPTAAADLMTINMASELILVGESVGTGFPSLHQSHHVGFMTFGTDGSLLASCGDGASYGTNDTGGPISGGWVNEAITDGIITATEDIGSYRSLADFSLDGKIVRIDPATGDGIPSNPLYNAGSPRSPQSRLWARGFRNPCRMWLVPNTGSHNLADGDPGTLIVGDVGAGTREEFTIIDGPNQNAAWPWFEGLARRTPFNNTTYEPGTGTNPSAKPPTVDWRGGTPNAVRNGTTYTPGSNNDSVHFESGFVGNCSIGGVWYETGDFPEKYHHTYFHADYGAHWIKNFKFDGKMEIDSIRNFLPDGGPITGLGISPTDGGAIYYVNRGTEVHRIYYSPTGNQPPVAVANQSAVYTANSNMTVEFQGNQSYDPEGLSLTYSWDFGDGNSSTVANPSHNFVNPVPGTPIKFDVYLTVTDPGGLNSTTHMIVALDNTPPVINSTSLDAVKTYSMAGNTTQNLSAVITDAEHSVPSQITYEWQTSLFHDNHDHPEFIDNNPVTTTGFSPVGCDDVLYFFRVELTVTDQGGLSDYTYFDIYPDCGGPVAQNDTAGYIFGSTKVISVLANDIPNATSSSPIDVGTITILKQPINGSLSVNNTTGEITYTHNGNNSEADLFMYKVEDASGMESNVAQVSLRRGGPPAIEILDPLDTDVIFSQDVTVDYASFGEIPPGTKVQLILNAGTPIEKAFTTGAYQFTGLGYATHNLTVRLVDNGGTPLANPEASKSISFTTAVRPEPGGVGDGLAFWVKANIGYSNSGGVVTWEDQSENEFDVSQAAVDNQPVPQMDEFNGNPAMVLDGNDYLIANNVRTDSVMTQDEITIISMARATGAVIFSYGTGAPGNNKAVLEQGGGRMWFANHDINNNAPFNAPLLGNPVITTGLADRNASSQVSIFADGGLWATGGVTNTIDLNQSSELRIGAWVGGCCTMTGELAEVIVYKRALEAAELKAVWTYLAVKYGVTIDDTSHLFYDHGGYANDIAGIGRQALTQDLNQTSSQSINAGSLVRMTAVNTLADGDYLVWGNNGASKTLVTTNIPASVGSRLERTWRVDITGSPGPVDMEIDLAGLGIPVADPSDISLLMDNADSDFSDASVISASSLSGGKASFPNLTLSDDAYFTLSIEVACLPYCDDFDPKGVASAGDYGCYSLTTEADGMAAGAAWFDSLVNISEPFRFEFDVLFGDNDSPGADGMAFSLHDGGGDALGALGGGLGIAGITPSISVEFDTYANGGEPAYDHMSVFEDGAQANVLVPIVQASATSTNIEDGLYHRVIFEWNPISEDLDVYFDGDLRLTYTGDMLNNIFGGKKYVYFGFSAGTGGETNDQGFCIVDLQGQFVDPDNIPVEPGWETIGDSYGNGGSCLRLTDAANTQTGAAWYNTQADMLQNFHIEFTMFHGDKDGADGASFMFHRSTDTTSAIGGGGSLLGAAGISPSVGLEFDIFNSTPYVVPEKADDHIAIFGNGDLGNRLNGAGPAADSCALANCGDIEDGNWHDVVIDWNANTMTMQVMYDGVLRIDHTQDLVNNIFGGESQVWFGFTGATGGQNNVQEVCVSVLNATLLGVTFPVELVSFDAVPVGADVQISWETATELNNDYFIVERTVNGIDYEKVGLVQGKGTTSEPQSYDLMDSSPYAGTSYYRLKQVDIDGSVTFSDRVQVFMASDANRFGLKAYPNPTKSNEQFAIEFLLAQSANAMVEVYNSKGQRVFDQWAEGKLGENKLMIPTNNWAKGMYLVKLNVQGNTETLRIIID